MSKSKMHFVAMLPLLSILAMSPAQMEKTFVGERSIASEPCKEGEVCKEEPVVVKEEPVKEEPVALKSVTPKFDARAAKVDVAKLEKDAEPSMDKFSQKADAYREKLQKARKEYMIDLCDKDAVAAQRKLLQELVDGLVALKEESKVLGEKNLIANKEQHEKAMNELLVTIESLLQDEVENEIVVLKETIREQEERLKEEPKKDEPTTVVTQEEPKKDEEPKKTEEEQKICDLEEKNKVLSKQVEDLLAQQKQIMQTMLGMNQMMVQMNQQMHNQPTLPSWMMSGPMIAPMLAYPVLPMQGQFVYYPQAFMPQVSVNTGYSGVNYQQPQMGQQVMAQGAQGGYQMPQQPNYTMPQFQAQDFQFQPQTNFNNVGGNGLSYNFGQPLNFQGFI